MSEHDDPYERLRPRSPTPVDELCLCAGSPPIMLQAHLSSNPLSCIDCNLEVPPERVRLSRELCDGLASWRQFHDCFFNLWLDSCEFEAWAKAQLEDPASAVNVRGRALVAELNDVHRAFYWWFRDSGEDGYDVPLSRCPVCQRALVEHHGRGACLTCSLVIG